MGASGVSVAVTFAIQFGVAIGVFLLFSKLRLMDAFRRFYAPKRYDPSVEHKPQRLPVGFLAWMRFVYAYPEEELIRVAGLDSAILIRVLRCGWEVFVKVSLVTCIILLPIHLVGGDRVEKLIKNQDKPPPAPAPPPPLGCDVAAASEVTAKVYSFSTFDRVSLSNIDQGSNLLWAHLVCVYIVMYIVLTTLTRYNRESTLLRLAFLANAPRGGPSHTVLITDIPGIRYGTVAWYLRSFVGGTLFVMLPAKYKKKILDFVEQGVTTVASGVAGDPTALKNIKNIKNIKHLHKKKSGGSSHSAVPSTPHTSDAPPDVPAAAPAPPQPDLMALAAQANARAAEEEEESKKKTTTGVLTRRRTGVQVTAKDDALDPWKQAGDVLGDINEPKADRLSEYIYGEVEDTYGAGTVAAVNPVWDQRALNPLVTEYNKIKQLLEDYLDSCASNLKRRKPIKRKKVTVLGATLGNWGMKKYGPKPVKVDAIEFWQSRLSYLALTAIPEAQQACLGKAIPAAFVTVNTRRAHVNMCTTLHHHEETVWQIQGAPEPKEVIWNNLPMRRWERSIRSLIIWAAYVVLMLFYMIPITAVQALIEVPKLAAIPVLGDIVNLPFIKQILEGVMPGLVLVIFLALLPTLLAFMCRLSGMVSVSQVDFGVVTRYFYFQVIALFVGSLISGALLNQIKTLLKNPGSILTILGVSIPMTATFFITYVLVAGIGKTGIKHLRVVQFVIFWLMSKIAATPRARARLWADQYTLLGPEVPNYTMAWLFGLVYCCINPIIGPVVLFYFAFALMSEKYNNLYVFKRVYESGGRLWYNIFNQFMVGLYVMQIIMWILLALKGFPWVLLLIPALVITFGYHMATLTLFQRPWVVMSAHDAAKLDDMDQREFGTHVTPEELHIIQEMYLSPVFKIEEQDVRGLLREAEVISRRINGEKPEDIEAALDELGYASAEEEPTEVDEAEATATLKSGGETPRSPHFRPNPSPFARPGFPAPPPVTVATYPSGDESTAPSPPPSVQSVQLTHPGASNHHKPSRFGAH